MKVVMIAHECGVPQWYWNGESGSEAWAAFEDARRAVGELNGRRMAEKMDEMGRPTQPLLQVCEGLLLFTRALQRADEPDADDSTGQPHSLGAWETLLSALQTEENYFDSLEARSSPSKLKEVSNIDEHITALLEDCVSQPGTAPDNLRKSLPTFLGKAAVVLVSFLKAASEVIANLVKDSQVRNCLPRIMSTESFLAHELSDLGENCHASLVSFGKLQVAVERVQWRSNTRAPNGDVEQNEDNVFFAVASDEGESPVLLRRLALLVKEATEMVIGSIPVISRYSAVVPPPALSCVMRALLHSTEDFDNPAVPVQGVRSIIRDFTSQSSDNMMRSVDDALTEEAARGMHCMTYVNVKLASYHTGRMPGDTREHPLLSSADVFILSAYVEGLFISHDGKYYDPGHGAAWDPNAPNTEEVESPVRRVPSEAQVLKVDAPPAGFQTPVVSARPVSPISTPDTSALTGPVKAAMDNLQAMSGQRDTGRFASPTICTSPGSPPSHAVHSNSFCSRTPNSSFNKAEFEKEDRDEMLTERPPNELPCLRPLWLRPPGQRSGERKLFAVFVDVLGNEDAVEEAAEKEIERKFSSIRILLVEPLPELGIRDPQLLPRMQRVRDNIRRKLAYIVDYLITVEKTHFNLVGGSAMEDCKGLVHFVVVDRTNHNRVLSPTILPMRPSDGGGLMEWTPEQQEDTERVLLPKVREMVNGAQHLVSRGYTESLWGDTAAQYYHRIWVESDEEDVHIDNALLDVIQTRPWSIRDHLEGTKRRCYELYALYLGIIPPAVVEENNRNLLRIILPHRSRGD
eukprot:TRINITY_DN8404_c0_g5_i1.p1 TRINITY_DN8404_c0_g5~~TRINITY_DN8404_c0_g5_i1.p1  ORF type:complete len:801 (+),score=285.45 TRINITY_DN8404_c0_g5_i1:117-2519(+)